MSVLRFVRLTKARVLEGIGRDLLRRFFERFRGDGTQGEAEFPLPSEELGNVEYYAALARLLMKPEGLPDSLNEALFAIDEMATPTGQERLENAVQESGLGWVFNEESTHAEIALQVWLAAPMVWRNSTIKCPDAGATFECDGCPRWAASYKLRCYAGEIASISSEMLKHPMENGRGGEI